MYSLGCASCCCGIHALGLLLVISWQRPHRSHSHEPALIVLLGTRRRKFCRYASVRNVLRQLFQGAAEVLAEFVEVVYAPITPNASACVGRLNRRNAMRNCGNWM